MVANLLPKGKSPLYSIELNLQYLIEPVAKEYSFFAVTEQGCFLSCQLNQARCKSSSTTAPHLFNHSQVFSKP